MIKKYDAQPAYRAVIHPFQRPQVMYIPDLVAKIVEDENLDDAKCSRFVKYFMSILFYAIIVQVCPDWNRGRLILLSFLMCYWCTLPR